MKQLTQKHLAPPHKIETPGRLGARDLCAPSLGHETRGITKRRHIASQLYIKILQTRWSRDRLERKATYFGFTSFLYETSQLK
jgi:hypothetical protein